MILRCTALALALALIPATASAQVSDADKATARALAQEGQDALDRKDFTVAADRFTRAGELVRAPTLALGLARAEVGLGRWIAAQETLHRLLREGVPAGAPLVFARALAEAQRELDALEPRLPSVVITVKGAVSPRVTLDGAPVPGAALGVGRPVDPGRHVVRAEAEACAPAEVTVTVAERKALTVPLTLTPLAPSAPAPVALPPAALSPAPSPPAEAAPPEPAPPPPPASGASGGSARRSVGFVALGLGGAGLLVGAVTGGLEVSRHAQLASLCKGGHCPPSEYGALDAYHALSNVPVAGLVAGGVLAVAGVVLVVTAPAGGPRTEVSVGAGPGFVSAQGRF